MIGALESTLSNNLVPKHSIASDSEVAELVARLGKPVELLPEIVESDPALSGLGAKPGDVIKIERKSPITRKVELYYRITVEDR